MHEKDGRGKRPGAPKNQQQERGQGESKERQPLPSVWEVLERKVRLDECYVGLDRWEIPQSFHDLREAEEYYREQIEVKRLEKELSKKGTPRDKLILDLFDTITVQLGTGGTMPYYLQQEEFKKFRSKVEPMPEEEITKEIREHVEYYWRMGEQSGAHNELRRKEEHRVVFNFSIIPSATEVELSLLGVGGRRIPTEQAARQEKKKAFQYDRKVMDRERIVTIRDKGNATKQEATQLHELWGALYHD